MAFYCYHVDSIIYLVSIPILAMFTLVTEYTNYLLYWCFIRYKEALHWWMSTSIKARGVFEGTIIQQIRVYLGSTVVAYWYVYNKVYQKYSTVGGNRVCPAAARLWVKSMGKGQRGFPKRHQLYKNCFHTCPSCHDSSTSPYSWHPSAKSWALLRSNWRAQRVFPGIPELRKGNGQSIGKG